MGGYESFNYTSIWIDWEVINKHKSNGLSWYNCTDFYTVIENNMKCLVFNSADSFSAVSTAWH